MQNPVFLFGDRHVARDGDASGPHCWKGNPQTVKMRPTWETFLDVFGRGGFYTLQIKRHISNKSRLFLFYKTVIDVILGALCEKKKEKSQGSASTYPEGSLSCFIRLLTPSNPPEPTASVPSSHLFYPQAPKSRPRPPSR